MEDREIIENLKAFSLTEGESKVYLALLQGESTKSNIIRKSGISSSIVYEILEKLAKKGLVSSSLKDNTQYFHANEPSILLDSLKGEIKNKTEIANGLIPLLKKRKVHTVLFANVYEGLSGLKSMLNDIKLDNTKTWLAFGVTGSKSDSVNRFWTYWHYKVRPKHRVKAKFIFSENKTKYFEILRKAPMSRTRYVSSQTPSCITVIGDQVLIMKYADLPSFVLLRNQDVATTFGSIFKILWKNASK